MVKKITGFTNVVLSGLVAGIILGIWLGFNPAAYSFSTYVEQQQGAISSLNTLMPVVGLITIVLTFVSAILQKHDKGIFVILLVAAMLLITSALITRFGSQPINAVVMTWGNTNEPSDWMVLRDRWWSFHQWRSIAATLAFMLITWANVRKTGDH